MDKPRIKLHHRFSDGMEMWICSTCFFDAYVAWTPAEAYAGWSKAVRHG